MEDKIIDSLKCFINSLAEGDKPYFPKLDREQYISIINYIWFYQYLLDYSQKEYLDSTNFNSSKFGFNDYLTDIFYKDTKSYYSFIKEYSTVYDSLIKNHAGRREECYSHEFLSKYRNYLLDNDDNILEYTVWQKNDKLQNSFGANGKTTLLPIEYFADTDNPNSEIKKTITVVNQKGSKTNISFTFKKVEDGLYVDSKALEDNTYWNLLNLAINQQRVYIYDLANNCEKPADDKIGGLLTQIRHNLGAHNNIFEYRIKCLPEYIGYVLILKNPKLALIMPQEIMKTIMNSISILTKSPINNYSVLFYEKDSQIATPDNLDAYLKSCKLIQIYFSTPQIKDKVVELVNEQVLNKYSLLKKEEREKIKLNKFVASQLSQYNCNVNDVQIKDITFIDEVKKLLVSKMSDNKKYTLSECGEAFSLILHFYGQNIIDKSKIYGRHKHKEYIYNPQVNNVAFCLRKMASCVPNSNNAKNGIDNLKILSEENFMYRDFFVVTALSFLTYLKLIENKLCDSLNYNIKNNKQEHIDLLQEISKKYSYIFHFSYFGKDMQSPSNLQDIVKILKAIRNSIAHNNFAINYGKNGKIIDSTLYFINKYEKVKVVCKMRDFLEFLTSDTLSQYKSNQKVFEASDFENLKTQIITFFQNCNYINNYYYSLTHQH